jgi:hypothetical protein
MRTKHPAGLAIVCLLGAAGCASAVDEKLLLGTYSVMVSAFGKSDPAFVIASQGNDAILFNFTYGFYTDYGAVNATGIRSHIDGDKLVVDSQPIHVDHSTGQIDGTLTGVGSTGGTSLSLTFHVQPSNVILKDANGQPLPAGSTVDYEIDGPRQ